MRNLMKSTIGLLLKKSIGHGMSYLEVKQQISNYKEVYTFYVPTSLWTI